MEAIKTRTSKNFKKLQAQLWGLTGKAIGDYNTIETSDRFAFVDFK